MVLVSIIIGLAIAHVLSAFASAIQRIRGHGKPIKFEAVYLLWTGYVLIWLVSFWWWEFKLQELDIEWSFGLYLFIISYAISLFILATVLVPRDMESVHHSYTYFMEGRKWFFGVALWVLAMDVVDGVLKGTEWGLRPVALGWYAIVTIALIAGMISERRSVQVTSAFSGFLLLLIYMFSDLGVLGSW